MPTLTPAYGRDYKSQAALLADIEANKDFVLNDVSSRYHGRYCSPSDFPGESVQYRYAKLRKVMVYTWEAKK